jgi:hypothetical protein
VYALGKDTIITGIEILSLKKENINSIENIYDILITTPRYMNSYLSEAYYQNILFAQ